MTEIIVCVRGKIRIQLDDGIFRDSLELTAGQVLEIQPLVWLEYRFLSASSGLVALVDGSTNVDHENINSYAEFTTLVRASQNDQNIREPQQRDENKILIPLVDIRRGYLPIKPQVKKAIDEVLDSGNFILGNAVARFEEEFSQFLHPSSSLRAVGVASGTDGLMLPLAALGVSAGDEVILQANAFIACALAISHLGATPVLVDCDPYYQLDLELVPGFITKRTRAILVVHMYGCCPNMNQLARLCKSYKLNLVEDASHAHGALWSGQALGTFGEVLTFL